MNQLKKTQSLTENARMERIKTLDENARSDRKRDVLGKMLSCTKVVQPPEFQIYA